MLRLSHLRHRFGAIIALDDLSLEVRAGEVFGLLGPNGAGKTTTIRVATGQLAPDGGSAEIVGHGSPAAAAVRRQIGIAPQALALYGELSARENLHFFGRLYGLRGRALEARCRELLELVGLTDRGRDRVQTFSGGMARRLNFAVAIVHAPALVFLDEPTAGVDPQSRSALFELVQSLRRAGCTVIYTTHYMEEAQRLCDRVGIVDRGRLLALDTIEGLVRAHGQQPAVIIERAEGEERVATDQPERAVAEAWRRPGVLRVRVERPDLESVFLRLTGRSLRD